MTTPAIERVRDDIDPANTWVVSDTHFGHNNIVGFCHRPEEHDQVLVAEWRAQVPDDATVIHLGDLSYRGNAWFKNIIAPELTGERKLLVLGNHDRQRHNFYKASGFKLARPFSIWYYTRQSGRRHAAGYPTKWRVSFSHYPWSEEEDGKQTPWDLRLHGHIHNNGYSRDAFVPFLRNHINLSVEQTKYRPVNLKLLLDAYLVGVYPETTDEQRAEAAERKQANLERLGKKRS